MRHNSRPQAAAPHYGSGMNKARRNAPRPASARGAPGPREDGVLREALSLFQSGRLAEAEPLCQLVIQRHPTHSGALTLLGVILAQSGRSEEATHTLGRAAACAPRDPQAHNNYGNALRDCGKRPQALACYNHAISLKPDYADAHFNRAIVLHELGHLEESLTSYDRALELNPQHASAYNNRGSALQELSRFEAALASYDRAVALQPLHAGAWNNRAAVLIRLQRFELALESVERALHAQPEFAEALNNRGIALRALNCLSDALASFEHAIALKPLYADAHNNRGVALRELERPADALASFAHAVSIKPDYAEAHDNCGTVLRKLHRLDSALACHDRALEIDSSSPDFHLNRSAVLYDLGRFQEALSSAERALTLLTDSQRSDRDHALARTYMNQALALGSLGQAREAADSYRRALELSPNAEFMRGFLQHARMRACDWSDIDVARSQLAVGIERGDAAITPFAALALFDSPRLQRKVASIWVREDVRRHRPPPRSLKHPEHQKVRVGYFSADFRGHAVSALTAELFELHDQSRFDFIAFSLGPDSDDALGKRIRQAFAHFAPLAERTDEEVVASARRLEIDIAVDLGGYTQHARPGIFALRAAPIQVSYLGYLGTSGGDFMDYLLADEVLVPREQRRHYSEKIAYLPSYQANDSRRPGPDRAVTRSELGLPTSGFVFCCFNSSFKIVPDTFASWMRILAAVPDSSLLLLADNDAARDNLRRCAADASIDPDRLVFVAKVAYGEYLARLQIADLFLDTLPYNAGTVASDALWSGLPVLTCAGESLAARMGASLLTAVGLPELVTWTRADYERRAIELASDPALLRSLRLRLSESRSSALLFDTHRLARNLETLYLRMYRRHRLGLLPEHLLCELPSIAAVGSSRSPLESA